MHVDIRGQIARFGSLLPPSGFWNELRSSGLEKRALIHLASPPFLSSNSMAGSLREKHSHIYMHLPSVLTLRFPPQHLLWNGFGGAQGSYPLPPLFPSPSSELLPSQPPQVSPALSSLARNFSYSCLEEDSNTKPGSRRRHK